MQGRTKLVQTTAEGHQVVVRIVGPGDMFGGVALLGDAVYPATAEALSASEALLWPGPAVARLVARHPALALNALRVLAHRLGELQDRYRELATRAACGSTWSSPARTSASSPAPRSTQ